MTANKTWGYTYDIRGNILSRKTYAYTTGTLGTVQDTDTYEYYDQSSSTMWGDALLRYDGTNFISYDAIGNPTYYVNGPDQGYAYVFSWQNVRQLASGTKGETTFAYTYNADGLRTKKVVDGVTTEYYWAGSQLAMMVITQVSGTKSTMRFYYDAEGRPIYLTYGGSTYFYVTNLQGDVVGLANEYGTPITYEYDAWGRPISSSAISSWDEQVMNLNPLRYRGYIYDNETGFYYLQSRYYDPVVSRFINADSVGYLGATGTFLSFNLLAYCENNPVMGYDPRGNVTYTRSIGVNLVALFGFSFSVGYSTDHHGNIAFSYSYAYPDESKTMYVGGLSAGFSVSEQITILDTVDELSGKSGYAGVSGGPLGVMGGDIVFLPDDYDDKGIFDTSIIGGQISAGLGVGADAHLMQTVTEQTDSINPVKFIFNWVKSWFT